MYSSIRRNRKLRAINKRGMNARIPSKRRCPIPLKPTVPDKRKAANTMCRALRRVLFNKECPFTLEELSDKPSKLFIVWDEAKRRRYWFSADELGETVMKGMNPDNPFTKAPFKSFELMRLMFLIGQSKSQVFARLNKPPAEEVDTSILQFNVTTVMQKLTDIISHVSLPIERFNHLLPFAMSDLQQELRMIFRENVEIYGRTFQRMTRTLTALDVEEGSRQETNKMSMTMWLMDVKDNIERQTDELASITVTIPTPIPVLSVGSTLVVPTRLFGRRVPRRPMTVRRRIRRFAGELVN